MIFVCFRCYTSFKDKAIPISCPHCHSAEWNSVRFTRKGFNHLALYASSLMGYSFRLLDLIKQIDTVRKLEMEESRERMKVHKSDCAIYNEPAFPKGDCDCQGEVEE